MANTASMWSKGSLVSARNVVGTAISCKSGSVTPSARLRKQFQAVGLLALSRSSLGVDDHYNPKCVWFNNDDLISHDKVSVSAPRRINLNDSCGQDDYRDGSRHDRANGQGEVDVGYPRRVARFDNSFTDPGALFGRNRWFCVVG